MRPLLLVSVIFSVVVFAQPPQGGGGGRAGGAPHKNLKVLSETEFAPGPMFAQGAMRAAATGLGVMCDYCHVQDRSSDEKPAKVTARVMFQMVKDINGKFPDGKTQVTCYTCHRGAEMPLTAPPAAQ